MTVAELDHPARGKSTLKTGLLVIVIAAFVLPGLLGLGRYLQNYWLYRGYPPPSDPGFVSLAGTTQEITVAGSSIGGRKQQVLVYLPPGYAKHPGKRYPVFYLLHGFPGRPAAFLQTVRMGVVEDILVARRKARPMILVMPFGSTGTFSDKEWANGIGRNQGWETFVARDLVHAIDTRYRTIRNGDGRALGGLSEGGYGALNIGLHHPGLFKVLESWSGYARADNVPSIFGASLSRRKFNSPLSELANRAPALRSHRTFVWFFSGSRDRLRVQNADFAASLTRAGIPHRYFLVAGGHDWSLWRGNASLAYLAASKRVAHG